MSLFTEEQLKELAGIFNLKRVDASLPSELEIRDAVIDMDAYVWWRRENGPEKVLASTHWRNIYEYPEHYQLITPKTKTIYTD